MRFYRLGNFRLLVSGAHHKNFSCVVSTRDTGGVGLRPGGIYVRMTTSSGCLAGHKNLASFDVEGLCFCRGGAFFGEKVLSHTTRGFALKFGLPGKSVDPGS